MRKFIITILILLIPAWCQAAQQIQLRRDTSMNWTSVNPVLAQGELGCETNTSKCKLGDGTTAWTGLNYAIVSGASSGLTVGTTTIASGTNTYIEYNNNGILGEIPQSTFLLAGGTAADSSKLNGQSASYYQTSLSLLKGTLTDTDLCTYTASGTLLDCNTSTSTFQPALSVLKGTLTDTDVCTYTASGTLLNCNTPTSTWLASGKLGTVTSTDFCHGDGSGNVACTDGSTYVTGTPWTGLYLPLGGGTLTGDLTISGHNIITDTVTGTKIGTATNQLLGFFNASPVVQQTGNVCTALQNLGLITSCTESGGSSLTLTDGSNTVTGTTQITVTGGTVGGSTPNATLTISAGSLTAYQQTLLAITAANVKV